ncbi:MAG: DUF1361 domain-containing protein [Candidatus Eisenbacteria bacterium]
MRDILAPRELQRLVPFVLLGCWCAAMLVARVGLSGRLSFGYLAWNLFLAAVPLAATTALRGLHALRAPMILRGLMAAMWLLFLPNAPYILTDFIHLAQKPAVPLWFDSLLLLSFAGTGLAMAYRSLFDVEELVARRFGSVAAVSVSSIALFLCGFGIYLGRFRRLNSWDVLHEPWGTFVMVAERFLQPWEHPRTWAVTLLYGGVLLLGYAVLQSMRASLAPDFSHESRSGISGAERS